MGDGASLCVYLGCECVALLLRIVECTELECLCRCCVCLLWIRHQFCVWFEGGEVVWRMRRAGRNVLGVGKFGVLECVRMCVCDMIKWVCLEMVLR